jgi:hypothetical protein
MVGILGILLNGSSVESFIFELVPPTKVRICGAKPSLPLIIHVIISNTNELLLVKRWCNSIIKDQRRYFGRRIYLRSGEGNPL